MESYKKRMIKEYRQLHRRARKLQRIIIKYEAGTLGFEPDCPIGLLREQLHIMNKYCHILRLRAEYENIDLEL